MKQVFIKKENSSLLTILFAGWGMDENIFKESMPKEGDLMICFNYCSLNFEDALLESYSKIRVIGWSMGVWAASVIMSNLSEKDMQKITDSVSINGTPTPVDDEYGIPKAIYQGTIDNFSERGLNKFNRRMCGTSEELKLFNSMKPQREIDELKEELIAIQEISASYQIKDNLWNKAIIGERDMIFPKNNQINAWEKSTNTSMEILDIAHYSKIVLNDIIENL